MSAVTEEVKRAFKTSPIKRKYKCLINWLTAKDTPGTVTAGEFNSTYFSKNSIIDGETLARYEPWIFSASARFRSDLRFLSTKYKFGWLGGNRSDSNGEFASSEIISVIYDSTHIVTDITITSSRFNKLVNFDLYWRDSDNLNWVLAGNYTNVGEVNTVYKFSIKTEIKGLKLEIHKIERANMFAQVVETQIGFMDDISEDIIKFEVNKELEYESEKSLSIGNISANTIYLDLNNTNRRYNPKNEESDIQKYLKPNRKIKLYIGIDMVDEIVWFAQGVFYLREINPNPDMTASIYAVDGMFFLKEEDFESSILYENRKISELVEILISAFGLSSYSIDVTDDIIPFAWFEPKRYATDIKELAIAEGGVAYIDEDDRFIFHKRDWESEIIKEMISDEVIIKGSAHCPLIARNMKNSIKIRSNPLTLQIQQEIYSLTETISIPAGGTKNIACYFSKVPAKDVLDANVTAGVDIVKTSETKYAYATFLKFKNTGGAPEDITEITIQGKPLGRTGANIITSEDSVLIEKYGKSEFSIDSGFIQNLTHGQNLADSLLPQSSDPEAVIEFETMGLPYLSLGELIGLQLDKMNIGKSEETIK